MIEGASFSVKDFGAVGNCTGTGIGNDDTVAIQAALDYAASVGGGTVKLVQTSGNYRITSSLFIPSYVTLEGVAPSRFPYGGGSELWADFTNANQWVIEGAGKLNGAAIPYNHNIVAADTYTFGYNCCVKNMRIVVIGSTVPYGGIRIAAVPGAMVYDVSVVGTGIGLLVNWSWAGQFKFHCLTRYYGVIVWEGANTNSFDLFCNQQNVAFGGVDPTLPVPAAYLPTFMGNLNGSLVSSFKLHTEAHYNRTWGLVIGASASPSNGNRVKTDLEQWSGGCFQILAYGTAFEQFYAEGASNICDYGFVATVSRFTISSLHLYLSGTGVCFDLGYTLQASITPIGMFSYSSYGYGPYSDSSSTVTITGVSHSFGPLTPQWNMHYPSDDTQFTAATLINSWANVGGNYANAGYRWNGRTGNVELQGSINTGSTGTIAFNLPAGYRPLNNSLFPVYGGTVQVTTAGDVIITGTDVAFNGISFPALL